MQKQIKIINLIEWIYITSFKNKILYFLYKDNFCIIYYTSMHFDNYLQTKNPQPPQFPYNKFHYPSVQNNTQNNSFRHSATNHNLPFNKTPNSYLQTRPESSKPPISKNFYTNDIKNANLEHKPMHTIPAQIKSQVTANHSYISLASNCQKVQEQKKYINLSPAKLVGRVSTGMPAESIPKIDQRRSQSINDPRNKDNSQNNYLPWCRQSAGVIGSSKNTTHLSPFQLNFSNNQVFSDKNNSFYDRKQSIQKVNYFKTFDNQWGNTPSLLNTHRGSQHQQTKLEKSFLDYQMQKQKKTSQPKNDSNLAHNENLYKLSSITLQSSEVAANQQANKQDTSKNQANKNLSFIEKDIQKLKYASKRVDQVYQNQISRNYYFNKFLEEKGIKPLEQDKRFQLKETRDSKELEKRISSLQKQLEDKQKEIIDKNKELIDQTKTIIDKNKVIDSLSIELKQYKSNLQFKQVEIKDKEKQLQQQKDKNQQLILLRKNEELFYQRIVQYNKNQQAENRILQIVNKENQYLKREIQQMHQVNKTLMFETTKQEQKIIQVQEKNQLYLIKLDELRQILSNKESQLMVNQTSLQMYKEKIREQQIIIDQLKKQQLRYIENTSQQNHTITEKVNKQPQSRNYQQEKAKLTNKINDLEQKLKEHSLLLLNKQVYNHEAIVLKLKELNQTIQLAQILKQKEQQRIQEIHLLKIHQEYVQKKFNELSRELKKVTGKLGAVTNQAQLGWKLLKETNNEVILLNLKRLNQQYSEQAEQIQ